jgi:hypothetical protein
MTTMIFRGMIFLLLENCDLKNLPFRGACGLSSLVNPWQNGNVRFSEPTLFQACCTQDLSGSPIPAFFLKPCAECADTKGDALCSPGGKAFRVDASVNKAT